MEEGKEEVEDKNWADDFVDDTVIELDIPDHPGFMYRPVTAGDENDWLNSYMSIDDNGKPVQDYSKLNQCKLLNNLVGVPYSGNQIHKLTGVHSPWDNLAFEYKWTLLKKLKPALFSKIVSAMATVDDPENSQLKN